jgi:tetratricopeptide (TPR) repeat protein
VDKLSQIYARIESLCKQKDFNKAAHYFWEIEKSGLELPPALLVIKADVIQLSDKSHYRLNSAEDALLQAIELEPHNLEAHIELGYFYYAIMEQSEKAVPHFEQAEKYAEKTFIAAILGKAKALIDLGLFNEAAEFLKRSYFANHPEIIKFLMEIIP